MTRYYVNKNAQPNGDHEVHEENCPFIPAPGNSQYLGNFESCYEAVKEAQKYYHQVNGCYYCSKPCHTQ